MPRYFFHRTDGYVENDDEGVELPDVVAACVEAVVFAGATLQEEPNRVWGGQDFRVEITDERGMLLFTVVVQAIDSPMTIKELKTSGPPPLV